MIKELIIEDTNGDEVTILKNTITDYGAVNTENYYRRYLWDVIDD